VRVAGRSSRARRRARVSRSWHGAMRVRGRYAVALTSTEGSSDARGERLVVRGELSRTRKKASTTTSAPLSTIGGTHRCSDRCLEIELRFDSLARCLTPSERKAFPKAVIRRRKRGDNRRVRISTLTDVAPHIGEPIVMKGPVRSRAIIEPRIPANSRRAEDRSHGGSVRFARESGAARPNWVAAALDATKRSWGVIRAG